MPLGTPDRSLEPRSRCESGTAEKYGRHCAPYPLAPRTLTRSPRNHSGKSCTRAQGGRGALHGARHPQPRHGHRRACPRARAAGTPRTARSAPPPRHRDHERQTGFVCLLFRSSMFVQHYSLVATHKYRTKDSNACPLTECALEACHRSLCAQLRYAPGFQQWFTRRAEARTHRGLAAITRTDHTPTAIACVSHCRTVRLLQRPRGARARRPVCCSCSCCCWGPRPPGRTPPHRPTHRRFRRAPG
jgi:hypothetical protein